MTDQPPPQQSCTCGNDDVQSARHGNGHLMWCASPAQRTCHATDPALAQQIREWLTIGDGKAYYGVEGKWAQCRVCRAHADGPFDVAKLHAEDRTCPNARLEAAAVALATVQAQLEQQNDVCVRLLRMFEPALSSRIPPIEEVLARAASLVALEAVTMTNTNKTRTIPLIHQTDDSSRCNYISEQTCDVTRTGSPAPADRDRRLATGLEATRRRLATGVPPYPTREEWSLLVEYLETEEPSVFVDKMSAAITAHLDTLAQAARAEQGPRA